MVIRKCHMPQPIAARIAPIARIAAAPFVEPVADQPAVDVVVDLAEPRLGLAGVELQELTLQRLVEVIERIDHMHAPGVVAVELRREKALQLHFSVDRRDVERPAADLADNLSGFDRDASLNRRPHLLASKSVARRFIKLLQDCRIERREQIIKRVNGRRVFDVQRVVIVLALPLGRAGELRPMADHHHESIRWREHIEVRLTRLQRLGIEVAVIDRANVPANHQPIRRDPLDVLQPHRRVRVPHRPFAHRTAAAPLLVQIERAIRPHTRSDLIPTRPIPIRLLTDGDGRNQNQPHQ